MGCVGLSCTRSTPSISLISPIEEIFRFLFGGFLEFRGDFSVFLERKEGEASRLPIYLGFSDRKKGRKKFQGFGSDLKVSSSTFNLRR